jgi:formylglycine-generating enzyme required for sulfatase activity
MGPFGGGDTGTPTPDLTRTQAAIAAAATNTPTVQPTEEPTATPMPTEEPTTTPVPTEEPTATPVPTEEPTATPVPTDMPTLTPTPSECAGFLTPHLVQGAQGCVSDVAPNAILPNPESAAEVGMIPPGGVFDVLEGPRCTQGTKTVWWRVDYQGIDGWTAEGSGSVYWLSPLPCPEIAPIQAETRNRTWAPYISSAGTIGGNEDANIPVAYVPAGCFMMGSENGDNDERPVHEVCLSGFWIGQTEITNAQYRVCVEQGGCDLPTNVYYYNDPTYDNHPVVNVTWHNARQYALWAGGLLPTEAQWEYAARGPEDWIYPWGNAFNGTRLNYCDTNCASYDRDLNVNDGYADTAPVGSYPDGASWVGALDMSGNVWEWLTDQYDQNFYGTSEASQPDPTGPALGAGRIIRGGSWSSISERVRASFRSWDQPGVSHPYYGFRVAFSGE